MGEWVKCSDKLPQEDLSVDVTIENKNGTRRIVYNCFFCDIWYVINKNELAVPLAKKVIAWREKNDMPYMGEA